MVSLTALWLPIILSAVVVFIGSSIIHMVIKWHRTDYGKLPNESAILDAIRKEGVVPGAYMFPHHSDMKEACSPEGVEKFKKGPVGIMMVMPNGAPAMIKYLSMWFAYSLLISIFSAYLTSRTVGPAAEYLAVFRVAGTTAFLGYGVGHIIDSIWKAQPWGPTLRHVFDGLFYALLTAGVFGWLWPR